MVEKGHILRIFLLNTPTRWQMFYTCLGAGLINDITNHLEGIVVMMPYIVNSLNCILYLILCIWLSLVSLGFKHQSIFCSFMRYRLLFVIRVSCCHSILTSSLLLVQVGQPTWVDPAVPCIYILGFHIFFTPEPSSSRNKKKELDMSFSWP